MKQSPQGRDCSPHERIQGCRSAPSSLFQVTIPIPHSALCLLPCEDATAGHRYHLGVQDRQPLDSELAGTFILDFSASTRTVRKQIPVLLNYSASGILLQQNTQFKKTTTQWQRSNPENSKKKIPYFIQLHSWTLFEIQEFSKGRRGDKWKGRKERRSNAFYKAQKLRKHR